MDTLPRLPERARSSQAVVLRPLQDIDVFVEDSHSKEFYNVLMGRILNGIVRFYSVIPLGGREIVERQSRTDSSPRPSICLVDGDLDWVAGAHTSNSPRLYVHQCYCVENYLLCEQAMQIVIYENSGILSMDQISNALDWSLFRQNLEQLVPLFIEFAVAHVLSTGIKTVKLGHHAVIANVRRSPPKIDEAKVQGLIEEIRNGVLSKVTTGVYEATKKIIQNRVESLGDKLLVVSGKDFLLPLQNFEARKVAPQAMTTESLMIRLAKNCSEERLNDIREFCKTLILANQDQPQNASLS